MARLPSLWPAATLIHLVPELEPDPETALVYLEVDALVRAWGLRPVRARHEAEGPRVVMRLGGTPSWDALADASAQVSLDKDALVLVGRTAAALRHAVRMLRSEDVRRLCAPKECFFGPFADTPSIGTFDAPKEEPSTVWRLADLGLSQGWSAKGEGEHVLRWFWKKPSTWRPLPWPEVELPLLASSLHGLGAGARVTLGFNGQTLATWELESGTKPERLVARLPKEVWNVPDWALELRVHLNLQDEYRCLVRDGDAVFLTFSPEGALRVPRDEAPRAHVDEFVRRSHGQLPRLRLDAFHDWKLMDGFAPVVASWRGHLVEQPWRLAKGRQECFAGCIELQWVDDGAGPGPVLRRGPSGKAWVDPSSDKGRPMVAVAPEALPLGLYVLPEEPLVLVVKVGTGLLDEAVTVPSFTDIDAPGALFLDGKWVPWGGTGALLEHRRVTPPDPLTLPTPVAATPLETVEQRRLRWVDFLTLGGALLALIAGGFWIRRSRP